MKKPFMDEVVKLEAEKIAQEKSDNFITLVTLFGIFIAGFIVGIVKHHKNQRIIKNTNEYFSLQKYSF